VDPNLKDKLQVMIIATGVKKTEHAQVSEIKQVGETHDLVRQTRPVPQRPAAVSAGAGNPVRGTPAPPVRRPIGSIFRR
jgi:cell division GTPase FtsZ